MYRFLRKIYFPADFWNVWLHMCDFWCSEMCDCRLERTWDLSCSCGSVPGPGFIRLCRITSCPVRRNAHVPCPRVLPLPPSLPHTPAPSTKQLRPTHRPRGHTCEGAVVRSFWNFAFWKTKIQILKTKILILKRLKNFLPVTYLIYRMHGFFYFLYIHRIKILIRDLFISLYERRFCWIIPLELCSCTVY